ncbi:MAG: PIN domain-containing protein [Lautropia sp.]
MTLLVDTSVWSLALRRDGPATAPEVRMLQDALAGADGVVTTGFVLQELLQGFNGPRAAAAIVDRFQSLPIIAPDRSDHIAAAEVRNTCRRAGVQVGAIDALLIQLCGRHQLTLLATDNDFAHAAVHVPFRLWGA